MSDPTSIKTPSDIEGHCYKKPSFPRKRESRFRTWFKRRFTDWIPAFAGMTPVATVSENLYARAFFYRLLSYLLRHPLAPGAVEFYSEAADEWETALHALPHQTQAGLHRQLENLFKLIESTDEKEWAQAFEQILGHTANSQTPSYELEYGEEHSHRQPQQLADIAAFYQAFGLTMDSRSGERVDHASTECEFMSFLCFKEAVAWEKDGEEKAEICQAASLRFFKDHLAAWLPAFATRLSKSGERTILKQIADFTFSFIALECEYLQVPLCSDQMPVRAIEENVETGCMSCALNPMGAPAK